jgi:hypothetical protein
VASQARHYEHHLTPPDTARLVEVHSLGDFFHHSLRGGHVRNYAMYTQHTSPIHSRWADAIGTKVDFHTARYKGFEMGITGIFTFHASSSDLAEPDPFYGRVPAFEIQLFDVNDPENKYGLPDYHQLNLDVLYKVDHKLKGLQMGFLYVYKIARENAPPQVAYYQVGFNHYNFETNFYF